MMFPVASLLRRAGYSSLVNFNCSTDRTVVGLDARKIRGPIGSLLIVFGRTARLAFVTSTTHDALSANMATYDAFVQGAADAAGLGGTWKALGSTIGVNSRTRVGMDGAGVGVLRMDSVIVV